MDDATPAPASTTRHRAARNCGTVRGERKRRRRDDRSDEATPTTDETASPVPTQPTAAGWHCIAYADGASRGNPGLAAAGAILYDADGMRLRARVYRFLGDGLTNNYAEYVGAIEGARLARSLGATSLEMRLDSELLVRQLNGQYRVRHERLRALHRELQQLLSSAPIAGAYQVVHVRREGNREADTLANRALDTRTSNVEVVSGELGDAEGVPDATKTPNERI